MPYFYQMISRYVFAATLLLSAFLTSCKSQNDKTQSNIDQDSVVFLTDISLDEQIQAATRSINNSPTLGSAYRRRAELFIRAKDFSSAITDADKAIALDSADGKSYFIKAQALKGFNQIAPAINYVELALSKGYLSPDCYLLLTELYIVVRQYSKAMANINEALKYDRFNARGYLYRGILAYETGDTIKAFTSLETSIELDPYDAEPYNTIADFYLRNGNPDMALQYLNSGLNNIPAESFMLYNTGVALQNKDLTDSALTYYMKAYLSDSTNFLAAYNSSVLLLEQNRHNEAKRYLRQLNIVKPDFIDANLFIANNFEALDDKKNALIFLKKYANQVGMNEDLKKRISQLEQDTTN